MTGLFSIVPLIVLFPLAGVVILALFGRRMMHDKDSTTPGVLASTLAGLSFGVAVLMFIGLVAGGGEGVEVPFLTWINIEAGPTRLDVPWAFQVDTLSVVMMLVVSGVGTLIHIYAIGYMRGDGYDEGGFELTRRRFPRFFTYMNLFLASMLVLVSANNYLMMFVGWELVGLCSYLLIGFWFDRSKDGPYNSYAARKAFIVNRIGDFGMILAIFLIFWTFGTLDFSEVFHAAEGMAGSSVQIGAATFAFGGVVTAITLLLLLGATGKSAQIPLFVWLPDAMAGPTPVSALIHAATMVTAGIYMITRSNVLYHMAPVSGAAVAIVGGATAFVAATIAAAQYDIKRVLAYSTISQLGFMIAAVGLGGYVAGIFHLATHAFFKALLFLSAGSVIHGMHHGEHESEHHGEHVPDNFDAQDMRFMGGLRKHMPITTWVYIVGALALAGVPPLAGFFSKDEILADASANSTLVYLLLTVSAFFTAFYMGRQIFMVFYGAERSRPAAYAHENPPVMTTPLVVLAGLSLVGGAMNLPGLHTLANFLEHSVEHAHAGEFVPQVALISTTLALVAIGLAYLLYGRAPLKEGQPDPLLAAGPAFTFLNRKWYWDEVYDALFVTPFKRLGDFLAMAVDWRFWHDFFHDSILAQAFNGWATILSQPVDMGMIDGTVNSLGGMVQDSSARLRRVQTGYVRNYALAVALGVVSIILALLLWRLF
jgi:NADH-quinone oxidoreductase subunit L